MLLALALDAAVGWPEPLYRRIGHPVTWLGALIAWGERVGNRPAWPRVCRRLAGLAAALLAIAAAALPAWALQEALPVGWPYILAAGVLAWPLVAARSLHEHVARVAAPLEAGDLPAARRAVAQIVGRDPARLDEAGVARAGLESLAENTADGVTAPHFWGALLGLPGIAAYKAVNTLDSMLGHRTPRLEAFGWACARIDDAANLLPARLTGAVYALAGGRAGTAFRAMARDARRHRSPNAGWPEAALAASLGVRLSGPRVYADRVADEPWLNEAAPDPVPGDLRRGLTLYRRTVWCLALLLAAVALAL